MSDLKDLVKQRGVIKGHLTHFKNYLSEYEHTRDTIKLTMKLNRLRELFAPFDSLQTRIEQLQESEEQLAERETVENNYIDILTMAEKYLRQTKQTGASSEPAEIRSSLSSPVNNIGGVKLPKVELPKFDGKVELWLSFKSQFASVIDSQVTLSNIQKLQYLRSALSGEAAKVIESLETVDESYADAWELLTKNYANKRFIAMRHGELLLQTPSIEKNSASSLRQFTNHIHQHLRSLKSLGVPVDSWDILLILTILPKLDRDTCMDYEKSLKSDDLPKLDELLTFLTDKVRCLEVANQHSSRNTSASKSIAKPTFSDMTKVARQKPSQAFVTSTIPGCPICKDNSHRIYECETFHGMSIADRIKTIKQIGLCSNCLRRGHDALQCRSPVRCRNCQESHHTLIHTIISESQVPISLEHSQA